MANDINSQEWPAQIADRVVDAIDQVRQKTTDPAITVARGIVFGVLAGLLGLVLIILLLIGLFRVLDAYLPGDVWSAYVVYGGLFTVLGAFLWSKRTA